MSLKKTLQQVLLWILLAIGFNIGIFVFLGMKPAMEFLGGYVIEMSLSMDNLFLFLVLFGAFGVPPQYQRRVLNWGILAVIVLRFLFIFIGAEAVHRFHWLLYFFGAILVFSGIKLLRNGAEEEKDHKDSRIMHVMKRFIPVTETVESNKFFTRIDGVLHATPLFAVLVVMNLLDIVFAMDSIPAIFAITTNTFIVYTSNLFAVMGLRSLYFVLERLSHLFRYLKQGVAAILVFTGIKLVILIFRIEIPILLSVGVIFGIFFASILLSVLQTRREARKAEEGEKVA